MSKWIARLGWIAALSGIILLASSIAVVFVNELPVQELDGTVRLAWPLVVAGLVLVVISELLRKRRN